ncbi:MAG: hypothetical protein NTX44_14640 [Ignavibacteriales bacterium]|nr:hypothetical protein [Ignavibacteriales bacterium]
MKSIVRYILIAACVVALLGSLAAAQDLQEQLKKLGHDAAVGYVTPILAGWGNDLNSAMYYSADLHDVLGFDVGVKVAMSRFVDADKTYSLGIPSISVDPSALGINSINVGGTNYPVPTGTKVVLTSGVNYPSSVTANTAVGAKDNTIIKTNSNSVGHISSSNPLLNNQPVSVPANQPILTLPGGFDLGTLGVPLPMPQLDLGLPFGLEFMLRYVPTISAGDVGKFNYSGFGLRYSISQWLPLFPVDIAAHFMTQKMNFKSKDDKDIFSASGTAYGVEVSKKLFILTLYGGFQLESSTLTLADFQGYSAELGQNVTIPGFEVKGSNKSRFTVGARLLLLIVNVHAEYSIAKNPVIAIGAGITIR